MFILIAQYFLNGADSCVIFRVLKKSIGLYSMDEEWQGQHLGSLAVFEKAQTDYLIKI